MSDNPKRMLGIMGGFLGNSLAANSDSTLIPAQVRAFLAKKKAADTTNTPKINMAEELRAAAAGNKGYTQQQRDSIARQFNHAEYIKHLDDIGYEVVKKKQP